jgi:hypothetical protein
MSRVIFPDFWDVVEPAVTGRFSRELLKLSERRDLAGWTVEAIELEGRGGMRCTAARSVPLGELRLLAVTTSGLGLWRVRDFWEYWLSPEEEAGRELSGSRAATLCRGFSETVLSSFTGSLGDGDAMADLS